jgi:RNA polymerase sigma-70 factor (ECF subfamily)
VEVGVEDPLLEACRGGDREAWGVLLERCRDRVYSLACRLTGDRAEAADLTQEVFLKLLTRLGQFRGASRFETWLHRVVVNTFLDSRRSRARFVPFDEAGLESSAASGPTPEGAALHAETTASVGRAVLALPELLRVPLVLRFEAGLSYEEMATALGLPAGTVASRLSRALRRLAQAFDEEGVR